jgi:L-alanine-DL-glutamate epimerase-like enolase superfamily enzyme
MTVSTEPLVLDATIDRLRVSLLEVPLGDPVPMAIGTLRARHVLLVEVAVDGLWGVGEVWVNHPGWAGRERQLTYRHGIAPLLVDRRVRRPADLLAEVAGAMLPRAEQAGAPGPVWQALSGLDLALWDLAGQAAGLPVSALLAPGRTPDAAVPVYASGVGPTRIEELCEAAAAQGIRRVKVRVGFGAEVDQRTLATVRAVLGDDVELYADANRAWTPDEAVEMIAVLRHFGTEWVEEPLRRDPPGELAALADRTGMPVAVGENLYGEPAFAELLATGRVGLLQPDPAKSGGLSVVGEVTRSAAAHDVPVAPHCYSGGVALAASVQLAAAFRSVTMVELDIRPNPLRTDLLDERWPVVDGHLTVPPGPGLGVALARDRYAEHVVASEDLIVAGRLR